MSLQVDLSVIVPVYNGEQFIAENLKRLTKYLSGTDLSYEVIVVDDGSQDRTHAAMQSCPQPRIRFLRHETNRGKYAAIISGMNEASGDCRMFIDADLPFELESIPYLHSQIVERQVHIVIGDRTLPDSTYQRELGFFRFLATRGFSFLIRMLVTGGLFDTQCGLKALRGDVAEAIFPLLTEQGFSGDVELLYIALKYNLEIKRIPVRLNKSSRSTVNLFRDSIPMLTRAIQLPQKWHKGTYRCLKMQEIATQRYWETNRAHPFKEAV